MDWCDFWNLYTAGLMQYFRKLVAELQDTLYYIYPSIIAEYEQPHGTAGLYQNLTRKAGLGAWFCSARLCATAIADCPQRQRLHGRSCETLDGDDGIVCLSLLMVVPCSYPCLVACTHADVEGSSARRPLQCFQRIDIHRTIL